MCLHGVQMDSGSFSFTSHSHSLPLEHNSEQRAEAAKKGTAGQAEMSSQSTELLSSPSSHYQQQ